MLVNFRSVLVLAAASWALVFLAGSGSSALAKKPVPEYECQQAKTEYYRFWALYKTKWQEAESTSNKFRRRLLRDEALRARETAWFNRDWYRQNCKHTTPPPENQSRFNGNCTPEPNQVVSNCSWYDLVWWSRSGRNHSCQNSPEHRQRNPNDCYQKCQCTQRMR